MGDHSVGASLLVVVRPLVGSASDDPRDSAIRVERETIEPGDAHIVAEEVAKKHMGAPVSIEVYRRVATYEAEVKVTMKKDGE